MGLGICCFLWAKVLERGTAAFQWFHGSLEPLWFLGGVGLRI